MKMLIYYQSGGELCLNPELKSTIACLSPEKTPIPSADHRSSNLGKYCIILEEF